MTVYFCLKKYSKIKREGRVQNTYKHVQINIWDFENNGTSYVKYEQVCIKYVVYQRTFLNVFWF